MDRLYTGQLFRPSLVALVCALQIGFIPSRAIPKENGTSEGNSSSFVFRDTSAETGVLPLVTDIHGHGAAWGDADGDGWIDLYIGTFHSEGLPNQLLRNRGGQFQLDQQKALQVSTRATGIVFADLDNDGDLDLYVASMPAQLGSSLSKKINRLLKGCTLFRNDGEGKFSDVSQGNGACPDAFGGRSVAALDFDGDGLLDLLVGEDPLPGYNGSSTHSSRLFRNRGELRFEDVSRRVGLPEGIPGLGVAAADLNNDGYADFFLASSGGGNRLFLGDADGQFRESPGSREIFAWPTANGDNMVCGVAFGDVNRDGLLDVVLGQHYERPWLEPVANRLYLNQGIRGGLPTFSDVTEQAGLVPLPMKAPHVEIQDFDNDGWPDISTSIVKFAEGRAHPVIFKHLGLRDGLPQFRADALGVNDFPTSEDKAVRRSGQLFEKMIHEQKIIYSAPGPSGDYDHDGKLDLFFPSWWTEKPSILLHNETKGGNWLDVIVEGSGKVNRMGIGSRIEIYSAGKFGNPASLLGCREISVGYGYASGQAAIGHFGLGEIDSVDIKVLFPRHQGQVTRKNVRANQRVTIKSKEATSQADKKQNAEPANKKRRPSELELEYPPILPGGRRVITDASEEFLKAPMHLKEGVSIAQTPPTVDYMYYPGQDYPGQPWSNWGDGLAADGKHYSAIGDHLAIGAKGDGTHGTGTALVFKYDSATKELRELVNVVELLGLPNGHYTPGKIHTRLDLGSDGWLYFGTHRGSERSAAKQYFYKGDWIVRTHPRSGQSEVVVRGPVPEHSIPTSVLDPERLIFYGGTAAGQNSGRQDIQFFAYDVKNQKLLYSGPNGPARYLFFVPSTGRVYYVPGKQDGPLMRFDPAQNEGPTKVEGSHLGLRSATQETPNGFVYTVSLGQGAADASLWSFDTKTEATKKIGSAAVGTQAYVASIDADPTGRYLYYIPGAHGGSDRDGSPVVQFDVQTGRKKVIAFLEPYYTKQYGFTLKGTYGTAIDPAGDKLYVTWNVSRGSRAWDCCGLMVIHLPESER